MHASKSHNFGVVNKTCIAVDLLFITYCWKIGRHSLFNLLLERMQSNTILRSLVKSLPKHLEQLHVVLNMEYILKYSQRFYNFHCGGNNWTAMSSACIKRRFWIIVRLNTVCILMWNLLIYISKGLNILLWYFIVEWEWMCFHILFWYLVIIKHVGCACCGDFCLTKMLSVW